MILKRTTNLLETLTASGHFGARVLGVRITNRLLAKGFAGLLGLLFWHLATESDSLTINWIRVEVAKPTGSSHM